MNQTSGLLPMPEITRVEIDFRRVYEEEFAFVWRSLRRIGIPRTELEDVTHDVFMTVYRRLSDFDVNRPMRPWLFGILYRIASDYLRRGRLREGRVRERSEPIETRTPHDALSGKEERQILSAALLTVSLDRRAVFILHDIEEMTAPEISAALGIPLNTVYSRIRLARDELAAAVRRIKGRI